MWVCVSVSYGLSDFHPTVDVYILRTHVSFEDVLISSEGNSRKSVAEERERMGVVCGAEGSEGSRGGGGVDVGQSSGRKRLQSTGGGG